MEFKGVKLSKAQEKTINDNLAEMIVDVFCDDIGYQLAEALIKKNKKKFEDEIKRIIEEEYKEIARKAVIRKLGI
jgi:signal recognition particle GTPase